MAKITAGERNSLPSKKFALPAERKYPIDTRGRAANAKARASEMANKGAISPSAEASIDRAADNVLHHGNFKAGTMHPDSKGSRGMHGDGKQHWSQH